MTDDSQPISILSETECWNHLSSGSLGRLVTTVDGQSEIFPINYVVQHRTVLFRTAEGTKLVSTAINQNVLFEADDHNVVEGWSVIVRGVARILHDDEDIAEAERAQLLPWTATIKQHYVRIRPLSVTGRRVLFGSEPDRGSRRSDGARSRLEPLDAGQPAASPQRHRGARQLHKERLTGRRRSRVRVRTRRRQRSSPHGST